MDFTTFNMTTFQTFAVVNSPKAISAQITTNMFSYTYTQTSTSSYRVTIAPIGYIYLNNVTFVVTTIAQPVNGLYAADRTQLNPTVYNVSLQLLWWLVQSTVLGTAESEFVNSLSKISDSVNQFFAQPHLQDIKKTGLFNLLFSGAQLTSSAIVSNTIPAQNAYEGARFWSSFVYFYTPDWQQNLNNSLYVFSMNSGTLVNNSRLLTQS